MSFNPNFYNNFHPNFTFHNNARPYFVPFPPPPFFPKPDFSDQEFLRKFDKAPPVHGKIINAISINKVREKLRDILLTLNHIKEKEKYLKEHINIPETEWKEIFKDISKMKTKICESMTNVNDSYLEMLRKLLAKRSAKRLRLKRLRIEKQKEKEERIRILEENSRKIDENMQKIKDDINRAKQEEEAKIKADIVLKEVLRKKHDAKKCIVKLNAMLKLYKARQNTAKGRGEAVSDRNAASFNSNVEKLKSIWTQKLHIYEREEMELRATLKQECEDVAVNHTKVEVLKNLAQWREFLYGGDVTPQADFQGDLGRFVARRSQWDQYISEDGTSIPMGWVLPNMKT